MFVLLRWEWMVSSLLYRQCRSLRLGQAIHSLPPHLPRVEVARVRRMPAPAEGSNESAQPSSLCAEGSAIITTTIITTTTTPSSVHSSVSRSVVSTGIRLVYSFILCSVISSVFCSVPNPVFSSTISSVCHSTTWSATH